MNQRIRTRLVLKKKVKVFISKLLLSILLFLVGMITIRKDPNSKNTIQSRLYERNLPFQSIKMVYEKYFGKLLSGEKMIKKTEAVFNEKIAYEDLESYQNGVKLKVMDSYLVPNLQNGIIVYIGEKEDIGNTVIIEQEDGVDVYYGNVILSDKKLYDYIEKGEIIGQVESNTLYLAFQRKGEYLDYQNYL